MSLILDALRKLDREKSSSRSERADIASEILRPSLPRQGKRIQVFLAAVSFTVVVTFLITYAVMAKFGFFSRIAPPAPLNPPPAQQQIASSSPVPQAPVKPLSPAPVPSPKPVGRPALAPLSRQRSPEAAKEISRQSPKIHDPAEMKKQPPSLNENKAPRDIPPVETGILLGQPRTPVESTPQASPATPPPLKISGILWHEEAAERRAVINGVIVTEGALVEGVKVVEIQATRVRFSFAGRFFEISVFQ